MPIRRRFTKKRTAYTRRPYKSTTRRPKSTKRRTFAKRVQQVINKNLEDKQAYQAVTDVNYNSGINSAGDLNFIIPNIANGTTDNARIGDQIRAKSLIVKGHFITNLTFNAYSQARIGVRMMIIAPKAYNSETSAIAGSAVWLNTLLKKGATTSAFTGTTQDLYAPINTDAITKYYDRVFYVRSPYVVGTITDGIELSTSTTTKFFTIRLPWCKHRLLKYDSTVDSNLAPTNYCPILVLGYSHLDNSAPDTVSTQVQLSWISTLTYQDA